MATTGVVDVKDLTFYVSDDGGTSYTAIACATDASIEASRDLREILCKNTGGGVDYKYGTFRWSGSTSGLFALDATDFGGVDLMDILIAGVTTLKVKFTTESTGDSYYIGDALLASVSLNSAGASGENATYSASFTGIAVFAKATVA